MILSKRYVRHPKKARPCADCSRSITGESVRLYGAAFAGEKPYTAYYHAECALADAERYSHNDGWAAVGDLIRRGRQKGSGQ